MVSREIQKGPNAVLPDSCRTGGLWMALRPGGRREGAACPHALGEAAAGRGQHVLWKSPRVSVQDGWACLRWADSI